MWNARAARATRALNTTKTTKRQKAAAEKAKTSFVPATMMTPRAETFVPSHGVK